jgi:hypothetical protein
MSTVHPLARSDLVDLFGLSEVPSGATFEYLGPRRADGLPA